MVGNCRPIVDLYHQVIIQLLRVTTNINFFVILSDISLKIMRFYTIYSEAYDNLVAKQKKCFIFFISPKLFYFCSIKLKYAKNNFHSFYCVPFFVFYAVQLE